MRQTTAIVRQAREFLHAAAARIEDASFPIAASRWGIEPDEDHLLVRGRLVATRMGASIVLAGGESMYPSEGVESLAAAIDSIVSPYQGCFPEVRRAS